VADARLIRQELGWTPRYDDLTLILKTALNWERHLAERNGDNLKTIYRKLAAVNF